MLLEIVKIAHIEAYEVNINYIDKRNSTKIHADYETGYLVLSKLCMMLAHLLEQHL